MKKILALLLVALLVIGLVACAGGSDTPDPTPEAVRPATGATLEPVEPAAPTAGSLIGTWDFMGSPYYVFEADGTGDMFGSDILWSASGGVLSVCITPDLCGTIESCLGTADWYYEFNGNDEVTLTNTEFEDMTFTYTRG